MSKLLASLTAIALGIGVHVTLAQNVDAQKDQSQGQTKGADTTKAQPTKPTANETAPGGGAQSAKTSAECDKLSGKEKDNCIQATPAGPVEMTTGQGSKGKSDTAKERDRDSQQSGAAAPTQSNDSMGHPDKGVPGAATGQAPQNNKTLNGKNIPEQSKDTVGHPEERATTGEAQTLQEPGTKTDNKAAPSGQTNKQPK